MLRLKRLPHRQPPLSKQVQDEVLSMARADALEAYLLKRRAKCQ